MQKDYTKFTNSTISGEKQFPTLIFFDELMKMMNYNL